MKLNVLSQKMNRHQSTISRWLSGTRSISAKDAVKLEQITGIDRRAWLWPDEFPNPMLKNGTTTHEQANDAG